jgi:hypothetical protein
MSKQFVRKLFRDFGKEFSGQSIFAALIKTWLEENSVPQSMIQRANNYEIR